MSLITLDFETYYAQGLGFKTQTTEEYIRDRRFEVIGVGVKIDEGEAVWVTGTHAEIGKYLSTLPWNESALLCHNTLFDGAVLSWIFNIKPSYLLDTLCMARAIHGVDAGGSLKALAERYEIGVKGEEVLEAKGKKRLDFTEQELARYGEYCKNDVELTYKLFGILARRFPERELDLIDMTLKMFTNPVLMVDDALLQDRAVELEEEKNALLESLMDELKCDNAEDVRKKLASNKKFAELLEERSVKVPMKESATTGKQTYALAKNDNGFLELMEHEDTVIQELCAVRLGTKSTIEESRIERFIEVGKRNKGRLPIPLKYYGAHTGRWSGMDKVNFQNLPSRDKKKKALKNAVIAPDGYLVINCDSSQIEARILVWLAGQDDVTKQFANGEDVYSLFATKIYEKPISKANPIERFVGKTCILGLGYGTGAKKLQHTLKTTPPGVEVDEDTAKSYVDKYRDQNNKVTDLWNEGDDVIKDIASWPMDEKTKQPKEPYYYGEHNCVVVSPDGLQLPNGLYIRYPELKWNTDEARSGYKYKSRKGLVSIWGGTLVENVVQALARIVVGEQMLEVNKRYPVVMTVHDAAVCVVPEEEKDEAVAYIMKCMSVAPEWAKGLPVTCEAGCAVSYGDC